MYTNLLKYKHQVQKERWYYFNTLRAAFQPFCWFAGSDPEQGPCCRSRCSALAASLGCCDSSPFQMQFPMAGRSLGQATATSYGTGIMCIHCILSWGLAKAYLNTTKQQGFAWRCHIPEVPSHPCQTHWKLVRLHKHLCKMLLEYRRHISTYQLVHVDCESFKHCWKSSPEHAGAATASQGVHAVHVPSAPLLPSCPFFYWREQPHQFALAVWHCSWHYVAGKRGGLIKKM